MSISVEGIGRVGIVGFGTMGSGIAEVVARHGLTVRYVETDEHALAAAAGRFAAMLDRRQAQGRIDAHVRQEIVARVTGATRIDHIADCELVIEAVPERLERKQEVMRQIDRVAAADAILATNTSSLSVTDIAVHSRRPNRVLGFHFFNPAPVMRLVELVRTVVTDDSVVATARAFAEAIGKVPVVVGDRRGFIANHLLFPYLNQAVWMVEGGYATKEDVDTAMRLGAGLPMGPIALTDLVGIDSLVAIMDAIHDETRDTRMAPRPLLSQLAMAGYTGRKAGRGFYTYDGVGSSNIVADEDGRPPAVPELVDSWTTVGVAGTSEVATGVVETCARAGFRTVVCGRSRDEAERVAAQASLSMQRMVDRGRLSSEEMVAALARIHPTIDLDDLAGADLLLEAGDDDLGSRHTTFAALGARAGTEAVLASTTSAAPVIGFAMSTGRPDRVVGLHFFAPAAIMPLVEIVSTVRTDPEVVARARAFVARLDKVGVLCGDRAGFIVNTLLFPYLNDAVKMVASNYATTEEIDTAMRLGCGYPMGPFELIDAVGLDTTLAVIERLHAEYRQPAHAPATLLRNLVDVGFLGRKAGRGFYVYD